MPTHYQLPELPKGIPDWARQGLQSQLQDQASVLQAQGSGINAAQQAANLNLYDPDVLAQLRNILGPYFQQERNNFTGGFTNLLNRQLSSAGQGATASAYARGLANPEAFGQSAESGVREQLSPQFFSGLGNLEAGQTRNLLNAGTESQGFRSRNLFGLSGAHFDLARLLEQKRQFDVGQANQPGFGDYLAGGLLGAFGSFAGGYGSGLGRKLAG
jgi:hypothetical protein